MPKEEWLLGLWAHLQLDPQVWGMGTLNVQGLAQPHKLQALLDWAADSPAQVVYPQECHRAESVWQWAEAHSGAKPAWRGQWFYTPGTGSSQGCLVLVKPSTILKG